MARNLTGSKRIIYDSCIDLYNAIQKWRSITADSHSIIVKIWTVKQDINVDKSTLNSQFSEEAYTELKKLSSQLQIKMENLEFIVKKLQGIVAKIEAISELSDLHQSNSSDMDCIPFKTWSLSKFGAAAEEIFSMFEEELKVKNSIYKEISLISEKLIFLFFEACWKFEPNINSCKLNILLDSLISELDLFSDIS